MKLRTVNLLFILLVVFIPGSGCHKPQRAAVANPPMDPAAERFAEAEKHSREGKIDEAVASYKKAMSLAPDEFQYRSEYIGALLWHRRADEAIREINACFEEGGNSREVQAELYGKLGRAYSIIGESQLALDAISMEIELSDQPEGWQYQSRGDAYMALGQFEAAFGDYTKAQELGQLSSLEQLLSPLSRCRAALHAGLTQEAFAAAKEATGLPFGTLPPPFEAEAYALMSLVLSTASDAEIRNGEEALRIAEMAIDTWKFDKRETPPIGHIALAAAYAENANFAQAIFHQQAAIKILGAATKDYHRKQLECYEAEMPFRFQRAEIK